MAEAGAIRIDVYHHFDAVPGLEALTAAITDAVEARLKPAILAIGESLMPTMHEVLTAVQTLTPSLTALLDAVNQAVPLLDNLAQTGNAEAQAVLDALAGAKAGVDAAHSDLVDAIARDTPVPTPDPTPAP